MSTYIYLNCVSHTPHLQSENEVGQHLCELTRIREEIENRANLTRVIWSGASFTSSYTHNVAVFLASHPQCDISITDEYGTTYPLTHDCGGTS